VGIDGRIAEDRGHARLQRLGDVMLQPLRLVVHLIPAVAQGLDQIPLQEPVVANHFEGDALAGV
jgi:hypothetical protein